MKIAFTTVGCKLNQYETSAMTALLKKGGHDIVMFDDIADYHAAYTGIKGEEFAVLDVDHKAILIFDMQGKYVAKSELPKGMKLRSQNHIAGLAFSNSQFFVYHEPEGEFGTFYGFKIFYGK